MNSQELTSAQSPGGLPLTSWLDVLSAVFPPRGTLVVGAGNGLGPFVQWLARKGAVTVWLIEGDEIQYQFLRRQVPADTDWVVRREVAAATSDVTAFYRASNAAQNGLIAPEELRTLWPHLAAVHVDKEVTPVTVDQLWEESGRAFNWLILDCLPSATLAHGASQALAQADVLILRVVTDERKEVLSHAQQSAVAPLLRTAGFRCAVSLPQRHPLLAYALYVRDFAHQRLALSAAQSDAESTRRDANDARARIEQERAAHKAQLEQLGRAAEQEKVILQKSIEERTHVVEQLRREVARLQNAASERETSVLEDQQAQSEKRVPDQQAENETLKQAHAQLEREKLALIQDKENLEKHAAEQRSEIESLRQLKTKLEADNSSLAASKRQVLEKYTSVEDELRLQRLRAEAGLESMLYDLKPFFAGRRITYVDVGACTGEVLLKILELKAVDVREAHLYEPNPDSFAKLKNNMEACPIHPLHLYNFAVGRERGRHMFGIAGTMTKMLAAGTKLEDATGFFEADTYPLDTLAETCTDKHIDLLKIDVEGAELHVLDGAKALLREQKIDVIYIEAGLNRDGTQQTYLGHLDTVLQGYGYRIFRIYEQTNEWISDLPLLRRCNCVYMSHRFACGNPFKKVHELEKLKQEMIRLRKQLRVNAADNGRLQDN